MEKSNIVILSKSDLVRKSLASEISELGYPIPISDNGQANGENIGLAIVDVYEENDIKTIKKLEKENTPFVTFSCLPSTKLLGVFYETEVKGHLHRGSNKTSIINTLEAAMNGDEYFDESVITLLLSHRFQSIYERISSLSKRELQIIDGIIEDLTNDQLAKKFNLSVRTVNAHKRNILQKLEARSIIGTITMLNMYTLRRLE